MTASTRVGDALRRRPFAVAIGIALAGAAAWRIVLSSGKKAESASSQDRPAQTPSTARANHARGAVESPPTLYARLRAWWLDGSPERAGLNSYGLLATAAGAAFLVSQIEKHGEHRLAGIEDALWILGVIIGAQFAYTQLFPDSPGFVFRTRMSNIIRWSAYRWRVPMTAFVLSAFAFGVLVGLARLTDMSAPLWLFDVLAFGALVAALGPVCRLMLPRRFTSPVGKDAPVMTLDQLARSGLSKRWAGIVAAALVLLAYVLQFLSLYGLWPVG